MLADSATLGDHPYYAQFLAYVDEIDWSIGNDPAVAGNQIAMKGKTLSPNAVATYLENLKKSPFFAEPVFKSLGRDAGTTGTYTWEMTLVFNPAAILASAPAVVPTPVPEKKGKKA